MSIIGKFLCYVLKRHTWKRNNLNLMRSCKRCGLIKPIKRRAVK